MSTAQQGQQAQTVTTEREALDAVLAATPRVQSIRHTAAQFLGVPPERVCDLLRNVWATSKGQPPLTDAEMFVGMSMIARFGLDPIAREVYVTRTSKGLVALVGLDGWIKILDRTEGYDGFEQELGWAENATRLEWVETKIYSKLRSRPTTYRAYAVEYTRIAGPVAGQLAWHMLRIFSLRHAARLFTPIGGSVVTEEEARWMDAYAQTPEDSRTRRNVLKDKLDAAAKEFEPIPVQALEPINEPSAAYQAVAAEIRETQASELAAVIEHREPPKVPTPAEIVEEYKGRIAECSTVREANKLVTAASNDPRIPSLHKETIAYLGELLQGNVTKHRQKKAADSGLTENSSAVN